MLSLSPLRHTKNEGEGVISSYSLAADEFSYDFSGENLLDDIYFDDLFVGIDDGDVLSDLELDLEMLAEFSVDGSDLNTSPAIKREEEQRPKGAKGSSEKEESVDHSEESVATKNSVGRKPAVRIQAKGAQGKRKVKVDWIPDLHRRFVQAVEQLGLDTAVPSKILELMGIDCLTRHNIASHLQKYRSHRKHLLAREAETANWSQGRKMYCSAGSVSKRNVSPCLALTMGFPSPAATHTFRPLHVWGHPTFDQSSMHLWPKHLVHSPSPLRPPWAPPAAAPPPPPPDPCYRQTPHQRRLSSPPVPGIPPHELYKADNSIAVHSSQLDSHLLFDFQPSKETIDAAIGDVLAKPLLPLPLGLKPPSPESVLVELQRQGVSKLQPSSD